MGRRALVLEADARDAAVLKAALDSLDVGVHFVRTQAALFDTAYRGAVNGGADVLIVDYELLVEPRLLVVQELRRIARGPFAMLLPCSSTMLATRFGILGVSETLLKPVCPAVLEGLLFPERAVTSFQLRPMSLKALEAEHIQRTLLRYENNISKTAAALGVRRTSLQRKLRAQSSSRKRDASRRGSTNDFQVR